MSRAQTAVLRRGGVARVGDLLRDGISAGAIQASVDDGELVRVRKGWVAGSTQPEPVIRAVRVGGTLACVSAARLHGLWVPPESDGLHVAVPRSAARLRHPDDDTRRLDARSGCVVHWTNSSGGAVQPVMEAIATAARCCGPEVGFVLLESALHLRLLSRGERALLSSSATRSFRRRLRDATAHSESGTESMLKLMLLSLGLPFRQQVMFEGIGRVDFLLGDGLVIEVDSRRHHSEPYKDRRRDALLSVRGLRCLRFMYSQIVYERHAVEAAIVAAVVRGDHVA
jgi:very-short-patch-repair endonuclease